MFVNDTELGFALEKGLFRMDKQNKLGRYEKLI
jgi:hypothetical protein